MTVLQNHGGTYTTQRAGLVLLAGQKRSSAVSMRFLLQLFLLLSVIFACLGFSPRRALAAGAYGAPEVKFFGQQHLDDEARPLAFPNALGYDAVYDEIYLVKGIIPRVIVYGPDLFPRASIGAGRGVVAPSGVTIAPNGEVYVTQVRTGYNPYPRITILNAAFFVDREIFFDEIPEAEGFIPKRIALNDDGLIYVTGEHTRGVMVLDQEGTFLRWIQPVDQISRRGALEEGENPSGAKEPPLVSIGESPPAEDAEEALPAEEDPYADIPEEFRPRSSLPELGDGGAKVAGPVLVNFVTIDSTGKIYLLSDETGKVYVYGPNEDLLFSFGTKGGSPGQLSQPRALAIDEQKELIYVVDYMRHTILIYDLEGVYLFEVGGRGTAPGFFNFPNAMITNKHGQFVVADLFNARIQLLGLAYDEWLNRYETGEESGDLQDEGGSDIEEAATGQESSSPFSEGAEGAQPQGGAGEQPPVAEDFASSGQKEPSPQSAEVIEVIIPEDPIPAFQGTTDD